MSDADNLEINKRARRRLVGAAALALLAAIVLPMTMDHEPYPLGKDIQVTIPDREVGSGNPRAGGGPGRSAGAAMVPAPEEQAPDDAPEADVAMPAVPVAPAAKQAVAPPPAPPPVAPARVAPPVASPAPPPVIAPVRPPEPRPAPLPPAPATAPAAASVVVPEAAGAGPTLQVGAYSNEASAARVAASLLQQGLPAYTEKVNNMTRVRVGPFPNRAAADKAAAQLKAMGHNTLPGSR